MALGIIFSLADGDSDDVDDFPGLELIDLRSEMMDQKAKNVEKGRAEGDRFLRNNDR